MRGWLISETLILSVSLGRHPCFSKRERASQNEKHSLVSKRETGALKMIERRADRTGADRSAREDRVAS